MTVLWTLLIVVGIAMILVAVWPSIRPGRSAAPRDETPAPGRDTTNRRPPAGERGA